MNINILLLYKLVESKYKTEERKNYEYNYDGNQRKKSDSKGNVTSYTYDGLGRLKSESVSSRTNGTLTKSYGYDMSGNRKSLIVTGKENYVTEYTYDADNRLEREKRTNRDGNIDVSDYLYDGNGNQIKRIKGKSKLNFRGRTTLGIKTEEELKGEYEIREYDLFNQLTSVRGGGDSVSYSYKPDGLRLSKTVKGVKTGFVWDGGKIIETTDVSGNPTGIYKYGLERVADGKKNYYIYNAHGDVTGLTDSAGSMIREYEYDAFGTEVNIDKNDTNPFRYCGEYYDTETESIYLRARNYNPGTGRFTSEDPARDGLNWYAYANNNPIMKIDPKGTDAIWITAKDAAGGFGHTSLIVQDEDANKWYYFFWGDKAVYLEEVPNESLKSLESFNNWNDNRDLRDNSKNYTSSTYIEGDFTATLEYYKYLVENTQISTSESRLCIDMSGNAYYRTFYRYKNEDYNLFWNNCLQNTYEGFEKGILKNGKSASEVADFGWYSLVIPNSINDSIAEIFGNNKFNKN